MITRVKSQQEIDAMRKGGKVLAGVLYEIEKKIKEGMNGKMLDTLAETYIRDHGMIPAFKGYHGFPATICFCINEEVVHGIPTDKSVIHNGDIVTVDCGVIYQGMYTDSAMTYMIGNVDKKTSTFVQTTQNALYEGIRKVKNGAFLGDIGHAVEATMKKGGYKVIRDLVGHGIGSNLHEEPHVLNYGKPGTGHQMKTGETFAIEPITGITNGEIETLEDGWMIVTTDDTLSCQWEHTVLVTDTGVEVLTQRPEEQIQ